jgi:hypothetical protein
MDWHRYSALGNRHGGQASGQRNGRNLEQAARSIEDWLETQALADADLVDDADELRQVGVLARAGVASDELNQAVRRARQHGWGWAPIALLLGETREQARQRLT